MHDALRSHPLELPIEPELRPYFVLQSEPTGCTPGQRFEGFWVTVWQAALPCVQVDRGRAHPVGRAMALAQDGDRDAIGRVLADASLFVTADESWLREAAGAGVPTVYVGAGSGEAPIALRDFDPARLRVVRPHTPFRRDLPLRWLHAAMTELVPGCLLADASESAKCRARLLPFLQGRVADLGHGGHKIVPHAVGVDFFRCDPFDWIGDVRDLWFFREACLDAVYSSHCLEDLWHPHQALAEWLRVLRPGGHLALYLPLRNFYPNVGTPGANPGHKDDYVPEDVEGFLRDLGGVEVVHAARREDEASFEVVARKHASRSFFVLRESRPAPEVSVLVVGDGSNGGGEAQPLVATVETACAGLAGVPHEVLVLQRRRLDGDGQAAVRDLAARRPEVHVVEDLAPYPFAERWEHLRRLARGTHLLLLAPGTIPDPGALRVLLERARAAGVDVAVPQALDPIGRLLPEEQAAAGCLLVRGAAWRPGAFTESAHRTPLLFTALAREAATRNAFASVAQARVWTAGFAGRPVTGLGLAQVGHDERLLAERIPAAGPAVTASIAVVILRTLGDCVLATPVLDALHARHPGARITVVTEAPYAFVFTRHPAVAEVRTVPMAGQEFDAWVEDALVQAILEELRPDRLVFLSDRLDSASYHHSGLTLQGVYAVQAGVGEAAYEAPSLHLDPQWRTQALATLAAGGVQGPYAVLHTRAGWPEKSLSPEQARALSVHLREGHGLAVVVLGGPGEGIDDPHALTLAGRLSMAESAGVIAGARVFVGPDSGLLHIASALRVPSLALYGGSSLRVAPPLTEGSVAVQAPGCTLPCGVTPCRERVCGAAGVSAAELRGRVDEVLAGGEGVREYQGGQPALLVRGPEGPVLVPAAAGTPDGIDPERLYAEVVDFVPPAGRRDVPRAAAAPVMHRDLVIDRELRALHARRVLARRGAGVVPLVPFAEARASLLRVAAQVAPAHGLEVLLAVAASAHACGSTEAAQAFLCDALRFTGDLVHGRRGRPRPAYRAVARTVVEWLAALARESPAPLEALGRALRECRAAGCGDVEPAVVLAHTAGLLDRLRNEVPPSLPAEIHEALAGILGAPSALGPGQVLQLVSVLRALGRSAEAEVWLGFQLGRVPEADRAGRAVLHFQRATLCVADPARLDAAIADLRVAARHLAAPKARAEAERVLRMAERLRAERNLPAAGRAPRR
ncbi:MAG: methyltransferase domain-containing protein [Planctomycetes bacterium]|nr:methyltransferase domain-containing protein [Planctomycetota bacterium]